MRHTTSMVAIGIAISVPPAHAEFFAMRAETFKLCSVSALCAEEQTCFLQFIGDPCNVACTSIPLCQETSVTNNVASFVGSSGHVEGDQEILQVLVAADVEIDVNGVTLEIETYIDEFEGGPAEVAVFRFAGDPEAFLGLQVRSVTELVDLGLLEPGDVLWVEDAFPTGPHVESVQVDAAGIPPDEIVVFMAGDSPVGPDCSAAACDAAVPASSAAGAWALVLLLAVLGAWIARRPRRGRA